MAAAIPRYNATQTVALLSAGFRPFFLSAGLWAAIAMILWIATLHGFVALPSVFDPVTWHYHEFLFGFVTAAMAGFLLTAIPNWTGRLPLSGKPLALLVVLWWAGRAAVAGSAAIGAAAATVIDVAFLAVFAAVVAREILAGHNWRNLPVVLVLSLLCAANILVHMGFAAGFDWQEFGKRLAIALVVMLMSLIGGRIVPSFTTNWLRRREAAGLPRAFGRFDVATLAVSGVALAAWVAVGEHPIAGWALLLAGACQAIRLARWRGAATLAEPLLSVLHLGYLWIPLGLILLGTTAIWPVLERSFAIHALTAGAMATMILAVMTRASLGHSGRPLTAGPGTTAVYVLVTGAALARIAAPLVPEASVALMATAATLWIAAFAMFTALYAPLYMRR